MAKASDCAPAYEELYHNHSYAPVPLEDDPPSSGMDESQTPLQDLSVTGHTHCDLCEKRRETKERRKHERQVCGIVAAAFMVAMICFMVIGIVPSVFFDGRFAPRKKGH
ncbi:hypothetical protein MMC34_003753 [Xylographa carneopallida]|nr:hypothetical protein [Xylographa carneopallida]